MISISDVLSQFKLDNKKSNLKRLNELHLSELAICGYKYRYKMDNKIDIPFNLAFLIGNSFEYQIVKTMQEIGNIKTQFEVTLNTDIGIFYGHCDAYDVDNNTIYELKTTSSMSSFKDIYERQLYSYMIAYSYMNNNAINSLKGIIWVYHLNNKTFDEHIYDFNTAQTEEQKLLLYKNIDAFIGNKFISGIENSICKFCENTECPANKNTYRKLLNEM